MDITTIAFVAVAGFIAWHLFRTRGDRRAGLSDVAGPLPYRRREHLLANGERACFEVLRRAAEDRYVVFAKVRMADVLWMPSRTPNRWAHWNRMSQKHLDFVLCDRTRLAPALVVELAAADDSPHRQERDEFVAAALAAAGIPLLRMPAHPAYAPEELAARIQQLVAPTPSAAKAPAAPVAPVDSAIAADLWVWGNPNASR